MNKNLKIFLKYFRRLFLYTNLAGCIRIKVSNRLGFKVKMFQPFSLNTMHANLIIQTVLFKNIYIYLCLFIFQLKYKINVNIVWCQYFLRNYLKKKIMFFKWFLKELLFICDYGKGVWVSPLRQNWLNLGMLTLRKKISSKFLKILKQQSLKFLKILKQHSKLQKRFFGRPRFKKISSISIFNNKILKTFVNQLLIKRLLVHRLRTRFFLREYKNASFFNKCYNRLYKLVFKVKRAFRLSIKSLNKKTIKNSFINNSLSAIIGNTSINHTDPSNDSYCARSKPLCSISKSNIKQPLIKNYKRKSIKLMLQKIKWFLIKFFKFFNKRAKTLSFKRLLKINNRIKQVFLIHNMIINLLWDFEQLQNPACFNKYKNYKLSIKIRINFKKLYKLYKRLQLIYKTFKMSNSVVLKNGIQFFRFFKSNNKKFYIKFKSKKLYVTFFKNKQPFVQSLVKPYILKNGMRYFQLIKTNNNRYICFKKSIFFLKFQNVKLARILKKSDKIKRAKKRQLTIMQYWDAKLKGPWYIPFFNAPDFDPAMSPFVEKQIYPLIFEFNLSYYYDKMGASIEAKEFEKIDEWAKRTRIPLWKIRNRLRWNIPKQ